MEPVGGEPLGVRLQIVHEAGAFDVTANPS
jgi:hypothetical protein